MENTLISSREDLLREFAAVLARTDIVACGGSIEAHVEKDEDGNKTENVTGMYAKLNVKLPGVTAVTIEGEKFYSKNANLSFAAFKLANSVESTAAATAKPKAATISASALRERLASINTAPKA